MSSGPSKEVWRKAGWLLYEGRVAAHAVGPYGILATVEGEHGEYEVSYEQGEWDCECPYHGTWCSHVTACWMVWRAIREGARDNGRDKGEGQDAPREAP